MMVRNIYQQPAETLTALHQGEGQCQQQVIFRAEDFAGSWDFVIRLVMPPQSSIGEHRHDDNKELYLILSGQGCVVVNGEQRDVFAGDVVVNPPFGSHGLVNDSDEPLELLVLQASVG
ncbi:hypothetical protein GCM10011369_05440 [Neiella marina]|uniref:Cupin type-2 domain-containing protein n=1 Tax=Neiella marina TaxID=508461 RepID=A0A8J2XMS9_9GAMM|nr:cupin domain-containing protein [Neiella marina]GGA66772.1 hypothetical protein GCM10011369_05440 [Neiella marina]